MTQYLPVLLYVGFALINLLTAQKNLNKDQKQKNEIALRFDLFVSILFKDLERRYLTYVAKASSNVSRDGVI